jgi:predicted RNA-binding Zn-ribbon protein involved in translation (DUF1610 family)
LAKKGVTRTGEAYCLQCKSSVDPAIERCPSCDSVFEREEVKAFFCPRCDSLLTLGAAACSKCGMKFKVKAIRHSESVVDLDQHPPEEEVPSEPDTVAEPQTPAEDTGMSTEQLEQLRALVGSITRAADARAQLLSHLGEHAVLGKDRLQSLAEVDAADPRLEVVEAEVVALSEDLADIMRLYSEMLSLADDISSLSEPLGLSDEAMRRGLAAKAVRLKSDESGAGEDVLRAREEQIARREEMVDRKIKGYAQKKKELDDREAELEARLERVKREQVLLEEAKADIAPEVGESVWQSDRAEFEREIGRRLARMGSTLRGDRAAAGDADDLDVEAQLSSLETDVRRVTDQRDEADIRIRESLEGEDEVRRLLRTLDQLLGQLPESVIQKFTQSEDYKLYERVLDRLKI